MLVYEWKVHNIGHGESISMSCTNLDMYACGASCDGEARAHESVSNEGCQPAMSKSI